MLYLESISCELVIRQWYLYMKIPPIKKAIAAVKCAIAIAIPN